MKKRVSANQDIRILFITSGVFQYQVANQMGLSANKFSELLRWELDESQKNEIKQAIQELLEDESGYYEKAN